MELTLENISEQDTARIGKSMAPLLFPGAFIALFGDLGSGKTTFIKLLCRLYDPTEGEILLNGIDIRKYDYRDYLALFSVVFQDFQLLSFPLGQNVAASLRYHSGRAASCLDLAGFGERLSSLPQGLETPLYQEFDEAGVQVSGGEAQKIALARGPVQRRPLCGPGRAHRRPGPGGGDGGLPKLRQDRGPTRPRSISATGCPPASSATASPYSTTAGSSSWAATAPWWTPRGKYQDLWRAQAQYYAQQGTPLPS